MPEGSMLFKDFVYFLEERNQFDDKDTLEKIERRYKDYKMKDNCCQWLVSTMAPLK
jgi:hypothetical protein